MSKRGLISKKKEEKEEKISDRTKQKSEILKDIFQKRYGNKNLVRKSVEYRRSKEKGENVQSVYERMIKRKITFNDFKVMKVIGRGAFGEVLLVKKKDTEEILAMKKMIKSEMLKKKQTSRIRHERDILVKSDNEWIVGLRYSFQDDKYLYLCMEYCPAGDMMTWLINKEIFSEEETAFYIAELVLSVELIHKMNFVHRDLKPDNILLDENGHIKLTDFGLCKPFKDEEAIPYYAQKRHLYSVDKDKDNDKTTTSLKSSGFGTLSRRMKLKYWKEKAEKKKREMLYSTVGSPGYIAPEVLLKKGYRYECDWWSVGVIMYEMIYGYPPFYADDPIKTCQKIVRWKRFLEFPDDANVSKDAIKLLKMLLCDSEERVGTKYSIEDVKNTKFFSNNKIKFHDIRKLKAPFQPKLLSNTDTSYFDEFPQYQNTLDRGNKKLVEKFTDKDEQFMFHKFTYNPKVDNLKEGRKREGSHTDIMKLQKQYNKKKDKMGKPPKPKKKKK